MSDETPLPAAESPTVEAGPPSPAPRPARMGVFPWLSAIGFVVLAAAIVYLWQYPSTPADNAAGASDGRMAELRVAEQKLDAIDGRLARLEQQPRPPSAADLGKITAQLDALDARVSDQTRLASRLDVLSGRIESLSGINQSGIDVVKQQIQSGMEVAKKQTQSDVNVLKQEVENNTSRLDAIEKAAGGTEAIAKRLDRIARIQAASLALGNGQPLGDLPDAPPALARYATAAPPTIAHLRLMFPKLERAALEVSQSSVTSGPFIDRIWERAQGLVTVRRGDEVVIGDESALRLTHASAALEAGDLVAAVHETSQLDPKPLHALGDWLAEAKALIDARAALTDMAAHI
jgi:hypothetical protein